jgi:hypothetical protein
MEPIVDFEFSEFKGSFSRCIIGFDCSGSMFNENETNWKIQTNAIVECFQKSGQESIQAFGWSNNHKNDKEYSVITSPLFVKESIIRQHLKSFSNGNQTEPSTFFLRLIDYLQKNAIPSQEKICISFFTDGVIFVGDPYDNSREIEKEKRKLKDTISSLKNLYQNVSIEIHIIDPNFNPSGTEELKIGKDVYNIAMELASEEKTSSRKIITKVVIHTLNNNFVELNQLPEVEKNMLPFDGKVFPMEKEPEFREWFRNKVTIHASNEDELCNLLLKLAEPLSYLVKQMVPEQISLMVENYAQCFTNTDFGYVAAHLLLEDITKQALVNCTMLKKDIRLRIQKFFEECIQSLKLDAGNALALCTTKTWISLPINNKLFWGSNESSIFGNIVINKSTYTNCGVQIGYDNFIPIIPVYEGNDPVAFQCYRLYLRANIVQWLKDSFNLVIDQTHEENIFILGTIMMMTVLSNAPLFVQNAYRNAFKIMLQKKLSQTTFVTMLQSLLSGSLPAEDSETKLEKKMEIPLKIMGLKISGLTLWYIICSVSEINGLALSQFNKCKGFMVKDFGPVDSFNFSDYLRSSNNSISLECIEVMHHVYPDKINCHPIQLDHSVVAKPSIPIVRTRLTNQPPIDPVVPKLNRIAPLLIICFRVAVPKNNINEFVHTIQTENEFNKFAIEVHEPNNIDLALSNLSPNCKILILPNMTVKNLKRFESKLVHVFEIAGMSTTSQRMVELLRMNIEYHKL